MEKAVSRSQLWSAYLGNLFEHYDAALFGFLSSFLAPLIFPEKQPLTALILTYAMIPLGMLARPLGSLFFGHVGDCYGRRRALFWTLGGMAFVSGCIALSPTYQQAGVVAPLVFCLGRVLQNFFASGETMGGAIFVLENTSEDRHDLLSGWYNTSTIGGILLASAGVALLCRCEAVEGGWRLLYAAGCLTALFGCLLRIKPDVQVVKSTQTFVSLWTYRKPLLLIITASGFAYANYTIALILTNGFVPLVTSLTKAQMMGLNTGLLVLDFCAMPFFGWLSSRISREKVMLGSALCVVVCAVPLFIALEGASLAMVVCVRVCLVLFGVAFFAPFHAWAQGLVPAAYRYAIVSFGYAVGSQLLGGPTAVVSLWLFKQTGSVSSVCWYWVALAAASSCILFKTSKRGVSV